MGYIYLITNLVNGKRYVGQTSKTVPKRFQEHKTEAMYGRKKQTLYYAMRKYGVTNFICDEIEFVDDNLLSDREKYWIMTHDTYKHGYNMTEGGEGTPGLRGNIAWNRGFQRDDATRRKIQATLREKIDLGELSCGYKGKKWKIIDPNGTVFEVQGLDKVNDIGWSYTSACKYVRKKKSGPILKGEYAGWQLEPL